MTTHYELTISSIQGPSKWVYNNFVFTAQHDGKSCEFTISYNNRYHPEGDLCKLKKGDKICVRASASAFNGKRLRCFGWFPYGCPEEKQVYQTPPHLQKLMMKEILIPTS